MSFTSAVSSPLSSLIAERSRPLQPVSEAVSDSVCAHIKPSEADEFIGDFEAKHKRQVQEHESEMRNKYKSNDHWFVRRLVAREKRIPIKGEERTASKRVADTYDRDK